MTNSVEWLRARATRAPSPGLEYRDALRLAAQQHEALETADVLREHEIDNNEDHEHWCEFDFDQGVLFDSRRKDALAAAEEFRDKYDAGE